jgi:hypothetical protein
LAASIHIFAVQPHIVLVVLLCGLYVEYRGVVVARGLRRFIILFFRGLWCCHEQFFLLSSCPWSDFVLVVELGCFPFVVNFALRNLARSIWPFAFPFPCRAHGVWPANLC